MSEYAEIIRKTFSKGDMERDKNNQIPEDVVRYTDIRYANHDEKWNLLDVYRPKNIKGKLPVIMSVHGGGWVYGDKDVYQWYCMNLAQRGFAVVNYSYRLAPEY
ncbi:MAG: alpha/beta hydrolase, partial [Bulleidia sp.]|nr:alpha/beta hydrolase [Bulleidia sp.]